jgi:outer membrane protein OmpA-like peptidoglycan-associated protein
LENLAWNDFIGDLPECEIGAGDVLTSKRGRIMWFPPYDLTFNENIKVSWEDHRFIGRGEPVYTYNNTERSGSLSFTMIVDHPMIVNKIKGERTEIWERYFKGDKSAKKYIDDLIKKSKTIANAVQTIPPITKTNDPIVATAQANNIAVTNALTQINYGEKFVNIYFPNNVSDIPNIEGSDEDNIGYQSAGQSDNISSQTYYNGVLKYANAINHGVNNDFFDDKHFTESLKSLLEIAEVDKATKIYIDFKGYASQAVPDDTSNLKLSEKRAENAKEWFSKKLKEYKQANNINGDIFVLKPPTAVGDKLSTDTGDNVARDSKEAVEARRVEITSSFEVPSTVPPPPTTTTAVSVTPNLTQAGVAVPPVKAIELDLLEQLFTVSECDMFEYLEVYDPHTYKTISEKIKYFQPAFHSMTPEGFNGRLNFLHQCTRQSRNIGTDGIDNLTNLSFGRPPICILRIGDFFHTKVVINSLNIDYGDIKWDLNPEGFVAPMIAKITLDFNFIGGQSLTAPINRLQNALSYNFYASMNMFEKRSDSVEASSYNINTQNADGFFIKEGEKLDTAIGKEDYYVDPFTLNDVKMKNQ